MTNKNISAETIARTIILALALINQIFAVYGRTQISIANDDIYQLVSLIWTIGASIAAWWKDNPFTSVAIESNKRMKQRKAEVKAAKKNEL